MANPAPTPEAPSRGRQSPAPRERSLLREVPRRLSLVWPRPTPPNDNDAPPEIEVNPVSKRRDALYRRTLALTDALAALCAVAFGAAILGDLSLRLPTLLAIPAVVLISKLNNLYDRDEAVVRRSTLDELPTLLRVSTIFGFVAWVASPVLTTGEMGRDQVLASIALLFLLMLVGRALARRFVRAVTAPERILIVGDRGASQWIESRLRHAPGVKVELAGHRPMHPPMMRRRDDRNRHRPTPIGSLVDGSVIDRVIIASDGVNTDQILDAIRDVKAEGVKVSVMPRLFEVIGSSSELDEVDGATLLGLRRYGLSRSSRFLKRSLDIVVAGLGLLAIAPLMVAITIAIKLDSRGPLFFRQPRMGRGDTPFEMLKFRSMVPDAESMKEDLSHRNEAGGGLFKIEADPRITRVGGFLRRTSLDELPQLLNVLRGDMSLVGPRPLVIDEDSQIQGWGRRRVEVSPGMTGLWQVFGSARIPMHEMVKIDYFYATNWSLWLDIKVLMRTIPVVIGARGL